jgi:hypothetical protein
VTLQKQKTVFVREAIRQGQKPSRTPHLAKTKMHEKHTKNQNKKEISLTIRRYETFSSSIR